MDRLQNVLCLLLVCWLPVGPVQALVRHPLPVLWVMPVSSGSGRENLTAAVAPAVRLALQDLKNQPAPLGNYEMELQLLDSKCDPAKALKALFDAMWAGPKYLLLFGGVCPPVTALIARSLPALSLVQVSFAPVSPSLSNRKLYGNLFSTVPSDRALNQAVVKLLHRHRWTRVGVVTQEGAGLSEEKIHMRKDLVRQLLKANVQVSATDSVSEDVCSRLQQLKDLDVRIIIGQFEEDSELFCCAYRLNLFGARYQWIVVSGGAGGRRLGRPASGCTASGLLAAANGSIRLQIRALSNTHSPGVSGRTPQEYQDSYLRQLVEQRSEVSPLHAFAYDAVWVAARALSQVMEAAKHREKYSAQRNTSMSEEEAERRLLEAVRNTQFEGVTGSVSFRNGERVTSIELIQIQGSSGVLVGEFSTSNQQLRLMSHLLKFGGPGPARDGPLVRLDHRHVSLLLYCIVSSAAAVTIIASLLVLCFVIINRKHWLLSSSGVSQDELLLLGVLLSSSSVLLSGLDGVALSDWTIEILCSARLWTLSVGHTVGVTVLFTKSWRLYSLCVSRQKPVCLPVCLSVCLSACLSVLLSACLSVCLCPSVKLQSPPRPAGLVLVFVFLLDVLVLTSWQILDPLRLVELQHSTEHDRVDQDVLLRPHSESCSSTNMELWLTAVYGYKAPLLGLSCFVAWSARAAEAAHPAISSRRLTLSVFAVAAFSVAGVTGSLHMVNVEEEEEEEELRRLKQQLQSRSAQLDMETDAIHRLLSETSGAPQHGNQQHQLTPSPSIVLSSDTRHHFLSGTWTHEAQVCAEITKSEASGPNDVNSPEHVRRRLSIQLPILHHSYLPAVGGVSSSSSSLFSSREAFVHC
ncbi:gamma-aminobutyric acid type B receptor subunit 2-like [Parambassis ranga]|uniref:Gamma-aminobutyric acid type B receptor subunit 2-like n=1 Tax=Parambassis ranga TaxID=210632 RepID=A0A6P7JVS0_9TELE|nr:gamma-aminobutyric acid type B receptor subunit 2-like [Parambassis ranga]